MRYICLILFIVTGYSALGQALVQYDQLAKELNAKLKEEFLRGYIYRTGFTKDTLISLSPPINKSMASLGFNQKIHSVLKSSKQEITYGFYGLNVYWDLYSDSAYTTINKPRVRLENTFGEYLNIRPSANGGNPKLFNAIAGDILRNGNSGNALQKSHLRPGWVERVELLIDKKGNANFISSFGITDLLDSTKMISWSPTIYYGKLRNFIVSFKLSNSIFNKTKWSDLEWDYEEVSFLDDKFQGQIVRFEENNSKLPEGKVLLSFVFNPMTNKLENPFIHRGDLQQGKDLIQWMEKYDYSEIPFYWDDFPEAKRIYFYIK